MQGFVTTPIAQAIATANGIEYLTSISSQGKSQVKAKLVLNANADRSMTEVLAKVQQVKYRLPPGATDPVITKITDGASEIQYISFMSDTLRSEEHTSELQSLMRISYAVFCLKKKKTHNTKRLNN